MITAARRALHWFAHRLGSNLGRVHMFERDGHSYIGHRCSGCGRIEMATHMETCRCNYTDEGRGGANA